MQRKMKSFHALNPFALYCEAYAYHFHTEFSSVRLNEIRYSGEQSNTVCRLCAGESVGMYLVESWNEKISFILFYFRMASVPMSQLCNLAHFSIWILSWFCLCGVFAVRFTLSSHFIHAANEQRATSIRYIVDIVAIFDLCETISPAMLSVVNKKCESWKIRRAFCDCY